MENDPIWGYMPEGSDDLFIDEEYFEACQKQELNPLRELKRQPVPGVNLFLFDRNSVEILKSG